MSDDERNTPTTLTGHQLGVLGLLRAWKTNNTSRNALIRKGRDAKLTHEQIAGAMGLSRPTVASVLNADPSTTHLPEEVATDGRFDLDKFETMLTRRHAQARETFWANEAVDLPPGARPVSWHATLIDTQWDTGDPTSDAGVEPMVEAAVRIMRSRLPAPVLVRRLHADQARALGFGTASDDQVGVVAVHYDLVYVRRKDTAPVTVVEQQDEVRAMAEERGLTAVEIHDLDERNEG